MNWNQKRTGARERYAAKYNSDEAAAYGAYVGNLSPADETAYLSDLQQVFQFKPGMQVLDVGAGSGTICKILQQLGSLALTALEPSPAMLDLLRSKPELKEVKCVEGYCDAEADRDHFPAAHFDVIISRQLVNGLFDPLTAFANWHHWLKPSGSVVAIDGFYGRNAWTGTFEEEVDLLPLSSTQSLATLPYLLEKSGFDVLSVNLMTATNQMPATRTTRYVVVAQKPL